MSGERGLNMGDTKTYVLCRRKEAADALAAVASSIGRGAEYLVVLPHESFDSTAQRLRAEDATARIIFVIEKSDEQPTLSIPGSSELRPPGQLSYQDAMTSDLAALAYAEAFRNAVSAAERTAQEQL